MYYEPVDSAAQARTSTLVEELGQVDYIFSDKTGTLTRNIMEFKMCSIGGQPYAETVPDDKRIHQDQYGKTVGYYDFIRLGEHRREDTLSNGALIDEFLTLLAVCHTVIPEHDELNPGKVIYQASSPDEAALVDGASSLGYLFHTRKPKSVTISVSGVDKEYEVLCVNEFNSTRKRMSVLTRTPDGKIKLMIKGADTVIYERLKGGCTYKEKTSEHLEEYANEGLRTLVLAYRDVPQDEYEAWYKVFVQASAEINNRQDHLDKAAEMIEHDLVLLGATAIEDKLQDGVPDTIHTLMEGGCKIWVLTGDRQETAINIGFSCKLITSDMIMMVCNSDSHQETKQFLQEKLANVKDSLGVSELKTPAWTKFWLGISKKDGKFDKNTGFDIDVFIFCFQLY